MSKLHQGGFIINADISVLLDNPNANEVTNPSDSNLKTQNTCDSIVVNVDGDVVTNVDKNVVCVNIF